MRTNFEKSLEEKENEPPICFACNAAYVTKVNEGCDECVADHIVCSDCRGELAMKRCEHCVECYHFFLEHTLDDPERILNEWTRERAELQRNRKGAN